MTRDAIALAEARYLPNVRAFLAVIRAGEGTADEAGYRRHFGGSHFDSYADHPRKVITAGLGRHQYSSSAAGAYQILTRTWDGLVKRYGFTDFRPPTQDLAALALIDGRKALDDVLEGRFETAVRKCNREWASLPGSPYGQPTKTMAEALATYTAAGGALAPSTTPAPQPLPQQPIAEPTPKEHDMPAPLAPILAAVLPSLVESIPQLGKLFGSGSEVADRNVKAAEIAVGIVQQAVGARNAQEAAEIVAADPAMAQAARQAIEQRWYELAEAGGGGIDGARKADAERMAGTERVRDIFKSHSFWIALALLPLVYMVVLSIIGVIGSATWSDDVRASIAGLIVGTIVGGLMGYYFGQTTSRNRTAAP